MTSPPRGSCSVSRRRYNITELLSIVSLARDKVFLFGAKTRFFLLRNELFVFADLTKRTHFLHMRYVRLITLNFTWLSIVLRPVISMRHSHLQSLQCITACPTEHQLMLALFASSASACLFEWHTSSVCWGSFYIHDQLLKFLCWFLYGPDILLSSLWLQLWK